MINKISLSNFRGIREAELEIAPITVLTGANNSGKSSVMYGLLALRNIVTNPNQPLDSFFSFQFMNLGGFKETVFLKEEETRKITLEAESHVQGISSSYKVSLGKSGSYLQITETEPVPVSLKLDVTFPYALSLATGADLSEEFGSAKITWNGVTPTVAVEKKESVEEKKLIQIAAGLVGPVEDIKRMDFVALKRGFVKPIFSPVPLQPQLVTEEEIATFIANDRDLEAKIDFYLEKILDKNFQARPTLGTANFYLQTRDRKTGFLCDLVNDGFGTNQLVWLLAKALRKDQTTICIEEPEIHLNPGAIMRLVDAFIEISREERRRFVISTHSEHLVLSLLNKAALKVLGPNDVRIYYLRRDKARTVIEEQRVDEKGQIQGGLKAFYDAELEQMKEYFSSDGSL
jgi:AAA ATPase domain/AAA domain, putative AbiEii toxin, Type IV TA system